MFVLCPKCKTKYRVDENKIGPDGAKIRCAKCQVIFRVTKRPAVPAPQPAPAPVPQAPAPARPAPAAPAPAVPPAPAPVAPPVARPAALAITGPFMPAIPPKAELLLADADETFLNKIGDELIAAGYMVWYARDGESALKFILEKKPPVAILEVMLPGLFGFEVCEKIKSDPVLGPAVKLILIGSVYEKNRFRRAPVNLYGADEYVDKYHDGVEVLAKLEKVLGFAPPSPPVEETAPAPEVVAPPPPPPAPAPRVVAPPPPPPPAPAPQVVAPPPPPPAPVVSAPPPRVVAPPPPPPPPPAPQVVAPPPPPPAPVVPKVVAPPPPPAPPKPAPAPAVPPAAAAVSDWAKNVPNDPVFQKAARLARTIVSDIALYNPDLVDRGVKEGNFFELLAKDIDDGKKHYLSKASPEVQAAGDYFQMALEDLMNKRRKKLGLS